MTDLVAGLQDIADGRRPVSVRWEGEPGGVFPDFARGETGWTSGRCSLAVHRVDERALDGLGDDCPVRGPHARLPAAGHDPDARTSLAAFVGELRGGPGMFSRGAAVVGSVVSCPGVTGPRLPDRRERRGSDH